MKKQSVYFFIAVCLSLFSIDAFGQILQLDPTQNIPQKDSEKKEQAPVENATKNLTPQEQILQTEYPDSWQDLSFSDFVGASESFKMEEPEIREKVQVYSDADALKQNFDQLQVLIAKFWAEWSNRQWLSNWDVNEVIRLKQEMQGLFDLAKQERQGYFQFVQNTDQIITKLKDKRELFRKFYKKARLDPALKSQAKLIRSYIKDIDEFLKTIQNIQVQYTKIYKSRSDIFGRADVLENLIDKEIEYQRSLTFEKSHVAFYETDFISYFNPGTIEHLEYSWEKLTSYNFESLQKEKFFYLQFLFLVLVLGFFLKKIKTSEEKGSLFNRPFGLAFTLCLIFFRMLSEDVEPLTDVIFWVLLISCFQWLLLSFVANPCDRRGLRWLIIVYGLVQVVDVVGVPIILYRIFLIVLAMLLSAYAYFEIRGQAELQRKTFKTLMKVLLSLCLATVVTQVLGYHQLSVLIFYGTLQSIFVIFVAWQFRFLLLKIMFGLFSIFSEKGFFIFKNFKPLLVKKIRFVTDLLGLVFIFGLLVAIWGIYPSWSDGIHGVWNWGISFEDIQITLGRVLQSFLILYITQFVSFILTSYLEEEVFPKKGIPLGSAKAINGLITYVAWVMGIFAAFSALGFELKQFAIIAGALSVGIGFGLQNIVNNFVSGLILLFERPIKVGDMLELDPQTFGFIEKVGLRSTVVRTPAKVQLIIPNSDFVTQRVINLTHSDKDFRLTIPVGVAYGSNTELVKQTLIEVANAHEKVSDNPKAQAMFLGFGDSSLDFQLWCWIKDVTSRFDVMSELHYNIDKAFREKGVTIPFPQRDLHLKSVEDFIKIENQKD